LRDLIIEYQMSFEPDAQTKADKLNLAMEYNLRSMVATYFALKKQQAQHPADDAEKKVQMEEILLKTAQTIIEAKSKTVELEIDEAKSELSADITD